MTIYKARLGAYAAFSALLAAGVLYLSGQPGAGFGAGEIGLFNQLRQTLDFDGAAFWAFFAALFAIMNPLVAVPLYVRASHRRGTASRRRLALVCSTTVLLALVVSALFGQQLLDFFAISIGAFRIAGGVIVLLMGLAMMRSQNADSDDGDSGEAAEGAGDSVAICPMAIPLLAGPGAIATMILHSQAATAPADYFVIGAVVAAMVALTYLTLRLAVPIARFLGSTGLMVVTRLIGMIVAAIAIDMMVIGLRLSLPGVV